jgi:hypothetical protein
VSDIAARRDKPTPGVRAQPEALDRHTPPGGAEQLRLELNGGSARELEGEARDPRLAVDERELAERIADRVFERVTSRLDAHSAPTAPDFVDAGEVARRLGVDRGWVYQHKSELGAIALGGGARPRLRFDRAKVDALLRSAEDEAAAPRAGRPRRRQHSGKTTVRLLEVKGRAP